MGFWDESRWTRSFGYRPGPGEANPYTLGYHIGQDIAGSDWYGPVPALRSGVVVGSGRSGKIGGYVVVRVGGKFDTYCHLNSRALPGAGTAILAGGGVAPLARSTNPSAGQDYTGSASTGPHLHFVVSTQPDTAYNPAPGEPIDPRPIIRSIINGSAAGGGATPFNQEDDMPTIEEILDYNVPRQGGQSGTTNLRQIIAWFDAAVAGLAARVDSRPDADKIRQVVFQTPINRQGSALGGQTNLGVTIAWLDANLASLRTDPAVLAKQVSDSLSGQVGDVDESKLREIIAESVEKAQAEALQKIAQGLSQAAS